MKYIRTWRQNRMVERRTMPNHLLPFISFPRFASGPSPGPATPWTLAMMSFLSWNSCLTSGPGPQSSVCCKGLCPPLLCVAVPRPSCGGCCALLSCPLMTLRSLLCPVRSDHSPGAAGARLQGGARGEGGDLLGSALSCTARFLRSSFWFWTSVLGVCACPLRARGELGLR